LLKIIQRYIAFNFLPPFLLSSIFFIMFLLTFQLFRIIRIVTNKEVEFSVIAELILHIAISFFPYSLPFSALLAGIYSMNKLSLDSEIIAMRSFGSDKFDLLKPLLIFGSIIALFVFAMGQKVVPYSQARFQNQVIRLTSKGVLTDIKAGHFFTDIPNVTLFATNVYKKGEVLGQVFIRAVDKNQSLERIIFAQKGVIAKTKVSEMDVPDLKINLTSGNIVQRYLGKNNIEKIIFKEYEFPLFNENIAPGFVLKDSMRSFLELYRIIFNEKNRKQAGVGIYKTELEFWTRINTPLLVMLFLLLGFNLGINKGRGRSKNTSSLAIVILVFYYILFFFGVSLGKKGDIAPFIAVFTPSVLLFWINTYLYKKLDWVN